MPTHGECYGLEPRTTSLGEQDVAFAVGHNGTVCNVMYGAPRLHRTAIVLAPPSLATRRSPGRTPVWISSDPRSCRMLLVPGCGLPAENRSARYAASLESKPMGTNPALSTPMSAPLGKFDWTSVTARPVGAIAKTRPLPSFGAIRSPTNRPNETGATAIPPSTGGSCLAMVVTLPEQPMANTIVPPSLPAVTSSRCPKRPTMSKAIPLGWTAAGRLAKRRARP